MYYKKSVKHLRVSFTRSEQGANWAAVDILFVRAAFEDKQQRIVILLP